LGQRCLADAAETVNQNTRQGAAHGAQGIAATPAVEKGGKRLFAP
jgi:hypothetical protein